MAQSSKYDAPAPAAHPHVAILDEMSAILAHLADAVPAAHSLSQRLAALRARIAGLRSS